MMSRLLRTVTAIGLVSLGVAAAERVVAQSPPNPPRRPDLPWMNTTLTPEQRADLLIPQLTLEQKVQQITNDTRPAENDANRPPGCEFAPIGRHIQGIPELAIPTVRMVNGGTGVRGGDCLPEPTATGVPSTPASAATFNPELNRQLGEILGDEARRHGHQVMLAPGMNLHRHPFGGRNYEYQSEDPYLSGVMAVEQIKGIQAHGIHANAKHFAGNEQETQRRQMATVIPPRALHELYLLPFEMAVKDAQTASIMCAFPEINGVSACSSEDLLKATLRERWGFQGYVMTDRRALHDLAPSIKAGVDWELAHITPLHYSLDPQRGQRGNPGSEGIRAALAAGSITVADLDQMLRRRYVQMFKFGHFDTDFDALFEAVPDFLAHGLVAREIAEQAIVLLKNENNFLPLDPANIQSVALIGAEWFAGMAKLPPRSIRADNVNVIAPYTVTPQEGLENVLRSLGSAATVRYDSGGGTGRKADRDRAVALAQKSDVVIVMVGDNPHELCDRETLRLPIIPPADPNFCAWDEVALGEEGFGSGQTRPLTRNEAGEFELPRHPRGNGTDQEALMRELVAAPGVAQKMVVVLKTEGMVLMPWLDQVPALLEAWYPGQEDGNAVANILFGLRNPSGRLPMTFGNSPAEAAHATIAQFPGVLVDPPHWLDRERVKAQYTEALQVGYRWYHANNVTPRFAFGFGLSYTTFEYSNLSVGFTAAPAAPQTSTPPVPQTGSGPAPQMPTPRYLQQDGSLGPVIPLEPSMQGWVSNKAGTAWVVPHHEDAWQPGTGGVPLNPGPSNSGSMPIPRYLQQDGSLGPVIPLEPSMQGWVSNRAGTAWVPPHHEDAWRPGTGGAPSNPGPSNPGSMPIPRYLQQDGSLGPVIPLEPSMQGWVSNRAGTAWVPPNHEDAWQGGAGGAGRTVLSVTYTITNTGSRQGAEVSQVYLTLPPEAGQPSKRLVGFQKVDLLPGESRQVTVTIDPAASNHPFSYWVPENDAPVAGWSRGSWRTAPGTYIVTVGRSSWDVAFQQAVTIAGDGPVPPSTPPPSAGNGGPVPPSSTPPLLTIDTAHVARVRDSLRRGDPQFASALTALEADANRALGVAPMSVMDKAITPPSGDKHDYMSQAPYWWPDPSKPDGRPYIRRDGERNPEIDRLTDRANLGRLASAVSTLALAFHFTGREEYATHAAQLVRVWFLNPATRMNPHLRFGQGIPGTTEGRSAGIIETRFLPDIIDGVTLLEGSSAWTGADDRTLKEWMRAYLTWLVDSPLGREQARRGNNQETWADVQVVALALYTGQTELARKVLEEVPADIADEFEPDGRQPRELVRTRAWDYSIFDLSAFLHLAALGERVGVDLWNYRTADGRSLRNGLEYLIPFATGEQQFPHQQITEFRPSALHAVLRRAAVGWNEPRYREIARQIGGGTPRLDLTLA